MVRHIFTLTALLVACISAVSALPAHPRHETGVACALPHVRALGPNGVSVCLPPSTKPAPSTQTLERRAGKTKKTPAQKKASKQKATAKKKADNTKVPTNRKARAKARVANGQPRATAKDKIRGPKLISAVTQKKAAKVAEKKDNRKVAKQRQFAAKVGEARQKQKVPPYGIDPVTGALRRPQKEDMSPNAYDKKLRAQYAKAARTAAYTAMSPADKAAKQSASAAKQARKRAADKTGGVKEKNRQKRVKAKANANTQRKAENRKNANIAKAAYSTAQGLPSRGATYTSPQGRPYNGKDVRQAVYASEYAKAKGGLGFSQRIGFEVKKKSDKVPKEFKNNPNRGDGNLALPGVPSGGLLEFPILHNKQNGHDGRRPAPTEARIITKKDAGKTVLVGKIGHPAAGNGHPSDHIAF